MENILARLKSGAGSGCILVGEQGIGKTALIHHLLRRLEEDYYVVHVRGSAFAGRTAFGALTILLSDLDPAVSSHPVLILRGLTQLILERAGGRPVLLAVDNAEDLDEFSAMVLSQMVLTRTAGMLAAFRDFSRAPAEFLGLWREGILDRADLRPLTLAETTELLAKLLGGSVSQAAALDVLAATGGNPQLIDLAGRDYRESGRLTLSNGTWVLVSQRRVQGGRMGEALLGVLDELRAGQVPLVKTLALAGSLPLSVIQELAGNTDVDDLQERGVLALEQQGPPTVRLSNDVLADAVRASLTTAQRRSLYEQVQPLLGAVSPSPLRLVEWMLGIGEEPGLEATVQAAREANTAGDAETAVRFITALPEYYRNASAVLELVRARSAQHEYGAAAGIIGRFRGEMDRTADSADGVRLLMVESRLLCLAATGAMDTGGLQARPASAGRGHDALLTRAGETATALAAAGTISPVEAAELDRELTLARAACLSAHGRFRDNAEYLSSIREEGRHPDPAFSTEVLVWLCEAWAMTGRQEDALALGAQVEQLLPGSGMQPHNRAHALGVLTHLYLTSGAFNNAEAILHYSLSDSEACSVSGAQHEVAEGLLHAYAGRANQALARLLPGISQLLVSGPPCMVPLAAAAAAYAYALRKDQSQARQFLHMREQGIDGGPWIVRRAARHFAALADAALGSDRATARLQELARQDSRRGAVAYELLALFSATRLGDNASLALLEECASSQQGSFPRMCETYARGIAGYDTQLLLQAGEQAEADGHSVFASEVSERALAVASGAGDRATVRFIHRSRRSTAADSADSDSADRFLSVLTARERSIARLAAAGTSNKAIAAELNISVRTVEGHLYQVYSKLHVGSRRELSKVIAEHAGGVQ